MIYNVYQSSAQKALNKAYTLHLCLECGPMPSSPLYAWTRSIDIPRAD